jgi:hypothetical protein
LQLTYKCKTVLEQWRIRLPVVVVTGNRSRDEHER